MAFSISAAWLPTPANVNALPEPLRHYIHQLETNCDPAGDQRNLIVARDTIARLQALIAEASIPPEGLRALVEQLRTDRQHCLFCATAPSYCDGCSVRLETQQKLEALLRPSLGTPER